MTQTTDAARDILDDVVQVRQALAPRRPVVFTSAHSGQHYPADFIAASRLALPGLRRSEDSFVDELFAQAPAHGAPLVVARYARAFCDPNREKWELDPTMFAQPLPDWVNKTSARVAAGLGTIARVVASGESIYRHKLDFDEARLRIERCWQGFHSVLETEIAATRRQFGRCLLVDCHSMPGNSLGRQAACDIVLGDLHGTSCTPQVVDIIEQTLIAAGLRVRRNDPYAGGYITRHYGHPRDGVSAVQIEIARPLYMDEARFSQNGGFERIQTAMTAVIAAVTRPC